MPFLLITAGPLVGRRFQVSGDLVVGRTAADVTIEDPLISRRHAIIRTTDHGLEIEDLGSLNGTWVNGERIIGIRRLLPGDLIGLGDASITIEADPPASRDTVIAARGSLGSNEPASAPPSDRREPTARDDELRTVTALFADIVGSTSIGEKLAPHEVKALIGESVTRMSREAERFGGNVQAYMGDGIAVFFGAPVMHEDDPERAARAALSIIAAIREYADEVESKWGIADFDARVGVNTGQVAVGLVGAADPQVVSVGDATNVAARLQGVADPGTIVVGEATAKALINAFVLEPLGDVTVKGRERGVSIWKLVSTRDDTRAAETTSLVGRSPEIARFQTVLEELEAGRGQIVLLTGPAGIGKTRLLAEFGAVGAARATWLAGHCLSFGTERLYDPFIELLRDWVGVAEREEASVVRATFRAKLELLPGFDIPEHLPHLVRLLGLPPEPATEADSEEIDPEGRRLAIRRAYRAWLNELAQQGPIVITVEDLQFADASTCELAGELLELTDHAPLLLIGTLRPEPSSEGWRLRVRILADHAHRALELPLEPLSDDLARELLRQLPRSEEVDESARSLIVASAEGNPLFLEQLLIAFAEGSATKRGVTWAPTATHRGLLTPTLQNLMISQIDRLPPDARQLAQTAAVVGRRFPRRVLQHLAANDVSVQITELLRAEIIRETRWYPEPEFTFRHGLLRQAALSTLPPPRRRELYGEVAAAFEAVYAGSLDEQLELLGHYFARSDDLVKALDYLGRAAERALALDACEHAIALWAKALDVNEQLGGDAAVEARLRLRIEAAQAQAGNRADGDG